MFFLQIYFALCLNEIQGVKSFRKNKIHCPQSHWKKNIYNNEYSISHLQSWTKLELTWGTEIWNISSSLKWISRVSALWIRSLSLQLLLKNIWFTQKKKRPCHMIFLTTTVFFSLFKRFIFVSLYTLRPLKYKLAKLKN